MAHRLDESTEWLETDALGGFASGTAIGVRTRRYHALLTAAAKPPTDRVAHLKGLDAWIETPDGVVGLSTQRYLTGHEAPDGVRHLVSFSHEPWPTWRWRLPSGLIVEHELFLRHGSPLLAMAWRVIGAAPFARLTVRPLLGATDIHALRREGDDFDFSVHAASPACVRWRPAHDHAPVFAATSNGAYAHDPVWYRGLLYTEERARGFDHAEDLGSPGRFRWDLAEGDAVLLVSAGEAPETSALAPGSPTDRFCALRRAESARRAAFASPLHRAADAYIVQRGAGRTVIAGYPWFGDWGRDTFISIRGLLLATGRWSEARDVLCQWGGALSEGMLPNRFTDRGDTPEFNSVDASLWFVIAAGEYLSGADRWGAQSGPDRDIERAMLSIVRAYHDGTRYAIRADTDGLLSCGEPGQQLTWMDARAYGAEVTPRIGKPVEVQALWINALAFAARVERRWGPVRDRAIESFRARFWNESRGALFDVVDADHRKGANDPTIRPNQIFAVGGLPVALLEGPRARAVVESVERHLLTPVGLRSLAPTEPGYRPRYEGGPNERDGAYHQGTVWPWLIGSFVEAWVRVRGSTPHAARCASERFLAPLIEHLSEGGLGHVSEIFDAEPPRMPRGCPFQAWSTAELLRVQTLIDRIIGDAPRHASERAPEAAPTIFG
ncbi:MAG TPA: glycogen debranching protein [Phycisphaerales bacterium]|nr:glycogen debranching protein [Phycisphaerales bacterium]